MPVTDKKSSTQIFKEHFTKANLHDLYKSTIADGASVGRDGVQLKVFHDRLDEEIDLILRKVKACSYQFTSYKEKLISKGAGKAPRQLSIPTIRDKLVLKCLTRALAEIFPGQVAWVPHSTIKQVHEVSRTRPATDFYLRLDIEGYYPAIDHKILRGILRKNIRSKQLLHLIDNAIKTPTGRKKTADLKIKVGVPQGLSISNILSAIYLKDIDLLLGHHREISYFRYVDDILFAGTEVEINELENSVPRLLRQKRKLRCHIVTTYRKLSNKIGKPRGVMWCAFPPLT